MSREPEHEVGGKCSESEKCLGGRDCQITGSSCQALKSAVAKLNRLDDFFCESIGTGFFSEVFKVTHKVTGQVMVLKKNLLRSNRPNMLKEVQLMNQLSHANILGFMGVCVHEGQLHALTEYINGGKLEQIIQDRSIPLPYSVRMKLALDIAKGMEYLHSKEIFHRDLTSKNVFVKTEDNGEMTAVVGDFGLATKIPKGGDRLATVGSAYWMSPECLKGKWYGQMSDVFSYGIILCEMIARVEADPDILPRTENFGLDYIAFTSLCGDPPPPPPFLKLAFTCCNYDPSNRPSFSEIVQTLENLISSGSEESKGDEMIKDSSQQHTKLSHRRSFSDDGIRMLGETMALQDAFYKPSQQNPFTNIPAFKGRKQVLNHSSSEVDGSCEITVIAEPVVKPSKVLQTLRQQEMQRKVSSLMDAICAGRCFTAEPPHPVEREERGRTMMRRAAAAMPPSLPSSPTFTRRAASTPKSHPRTAKLRTCSSGSNLAALEDHVAVLRRRCSCESGFFSSVGEDFCLPECVASSVTLSSSSAASSLLLDSNPYGDSSCDGLMRHLPRRHTKRASSVYTDSSEDISINTIDSDHQDEKKLLGGAEPQQIHKMVEYFESKQSSEPTAFYRHLRSTYENRHRRAPMHRLLVCEGAVSSKLQIFDKK